MEFKTIEEYYKEFRNTGKESFYDFLEEKLQEAKNNNNQELEGYIYSLQNEVANNEFYDFQEAETKREEQENWVGNTYDEEIEDEPVEETTVEGSSTSSYVENEEKEALLAKEMKFKSARDAGFEINEFGEIIRPTKPMDEMSVEELAKTEAEYDKIITDNDEKIKQAYIERLLKKQQTIESQRAVLKELEGQGIDIDD